MASNSILVVEDEPDIRELLRFTLHRAQFDVFLAADSEEAIRLPRRPTSFSRDHRLDVAWDEWD